MHHGEGLRRLLKVEGYAPEAAEALVEALVSDPADARLSDPDRELLDYAEKLTLAPGDVDATDIEALRAQGFDDRAIHDACAVGRLLRVREPDRRRARRRARGGKRRVSPAVKDIDHLIYATPDLALGVERIADLLGVEPVFGGRHPAWGTANHLLSLGTGVYLEILGPDPEAPPGARGGLWEIESLASPRLLTWAAKGTDLEARVERARAAGVELGAVRAGERARPDRTVLRWTVTDPQRLRGDGLIPFFVDWGDTPHPSASSPAGGELLELRGEHPEPGPVREALAALELDLAVTHATEPGLVARIRTIDGREVDLR